MNRIKLQIISSQLQAEEKLPAVRELATEARINPNAIQRALSDLEQEGFVYSQRTSGHFITNVMA
ncbi:MAG: GntR family transcriptional regulator [Streptococcus sp.]|nr:MAG: GntR family transcriptional regulator [Streptococcus sp.]